MSVEIKQGSLYAFASPIFDETQGEYVWGIADPPPPVPRDDDQFYTIRDSDRLDLIAHRLLGNARLFWVIMHYNNIPYALDLTRFKNVEIRIPSRETVERYYVNGPERLRAG